MHYLIWKKCIILLSQLLFAFSEIWQPRSNENIFLDYLIFRQSFVLQFCHLAAPLRDGPTRELKNPIPVTIVKNTISQN